MNKIESKVSEVITRNTLVKETENHIFTIKNVELTKDFKIVSRAKGVIVHKDGTHCGDFIINGSNRQTLSVTLNLDCKELLVDLLAVLNDIESMNVVEVDEFTYTSEQTEQ